MSRQEKGAEAVSVGVSVTQCSVHLCLPVAVLLLAVANTGAGREGKVTMI